MQIAGCVGLGVELEEGSLWLQWLRYASASSAGAGRCGETLAFEQTYHRWWRSRGTRSVVAEQEGMEVS